MEIYLDNSTTTKPSERAIGALYPYLRHSYGVPFAPHKKGQEVLPALEKSYRAIYEVLGLEEEEDFVFTSSGSESVSHVLLSTYFDVTIPTGKNHFVTSTVDEAPSLMGIAHLERLGCVGSLAEVGEHGTLSKESVAEALTPRTALLSLSLGNGLTGSLHPMNEIRELCRERGVLLHLDITHALGKYYLEEEHLGVDFLTFHGNVLHAPQGTGGLAIRRGRKLSPFIQGGFEQGGFRAGVFSVASAIALGVSFQELRESRDYMLTEIARLRLLFEEILKEKIPDVCILFEGENRLPHISAVAFPLVCNEALLYFLHKSGVFASIGGGNFQQIGLVLQAAKVPLEMTQTAVSFSLSRYTTEEEIVRACDIVAKAVQELRKGSYHL